MISVRAVSKSFGAVRAVHGVSFEVPRGQVVGLLGANGAGKTTTIRMITGFFPPDSGAVVVAGHDTLDDSRAARRAIGYLPESAPAYGEMATEDLLRFRARLYGVPRRARAAAIDRVVDRCELGDVRRRRVGALSKGYRQRVGLAAALLHDPPVLVLDEPTNALDPRQIRATRRLIRDLGTDRTVLVSSHILPEVEQTCDRIIIMARGQVRVDARPGQLLGSLRQTAPYLVEAKAASPGAVERVWMIFRNLPGVSEVASKAGPATEPGWALLQVTPRADAGDLREAIAAAAVLGGVLVRELRREAVGLERVFLQLVDTEDGEAGPTTDGGAT